MSSGQTSGDAESAVPAEWSAGDVILGLYEVKGVLGEGGMGRVYRVHHRGWDVDLAVKSPRAEVLAAGGREAFVREAEAWAELGLHPHTVSCYYVRTLGGIPRVFAECVEGGSLHDWIRDRRLYEGGPNAALARILDVAIQFAWGLDYAHERGLVHQDVKPHNVMMTPDGSAKVTDFGLARSRATTAGVAAVPGGTLLVSSGGMTPAYCSPEQAARQPLTRRTDVWSWAVSVLEMFTGEVTWASGVAAPSVLEAYLDAPAEEPGLARMPTQVTDLLRTCFIREPDRRPRTMAEVATTLRQIYASVLGERHAREAPIAAPDTAESLNNRALSLLDLGRCDKAEALWAQALRLHPDHPEAGFNAGIRRWRSGQVDDLELVRQVRVTGESEWLGHYLEALVHLERADSAAALAALAGMPETERKREEVRSALAAATRRPPSPARILRIAEGHTRLRLTADGSRVLSAGNEATLKLWDVATTRCIRTFVGHSDAVTTFRLCAGGRQALSGSDDGTIRHWDVATGRCLAVLDHGEPITVVLPGGGGRYVIAVSSGATSVVRFWDLATGNCLKTVAGFDHSTVEKDEDYIIPMGTLWELAVNRFQGAGVTLGASGRHAISGDGWGRDAVQLWDVETGRCIRTLRGHTRGVNSVELSADDRLALSGGDDETIKLWEVETGRCIRTFVHSQSVDFARLSTDAQRAASVSSESLKLWDVATGKCVRTLDGHDWLDLSADLQVVLCRDADGAFRISDLGEFWSAPRARPALSRVVRSEDAVDVRRHHDRDLEEARRALVSGDAAAAARHVRRARSRTGHAFAEEASEVWSQVCARLPRAGLVGVRELHAIAAHAGVMTAVRLSPDGARVASCGPEERVSAGDQVFWRVAVWDVATGRGLRSLDHLYRALGTTIDFGGDAGRLVRGEDDAVVGLIAPTAETGASSGSAQREPGNSATASRLSRDRLYVLSEVQVRSITTIRLSDATGRCLREFTGHRQKVNSVVLSADGRHLLSASGDSGEYHVDRSVRIWELATARCLHVLEGHTAAVSSVNASADGRHVLSGSHDGTLRFWDAATGVCLRTLEGHQGPVNSVRLSTDGRFAISGGCDATVRIWETATGRCLKTARQHAEAVTSVDLSADARVAVSGSNDGTLRVWLLDWEVEDRATADWDEGARPYLDVFLRCQTPHAGALPGPDEPTSEEAIVRAFMRDGHPIWTEDDFQRLLTTLGHAGYGWLRPEGVRRELQRMAAKARS